MAEDNCIAIPRNVNDLTGHVYGKWTVVQYAGFVPNSRKAAWLCECGCGTRKIIRASNLRNERSLNCGCVRREKTILRNTRHGQSRTPEYIIWCGMIKRCYNRNDASYKDYGGRGICVCDRWKNSFPSFLSDMGKRPSSKHSIDRIDNYGNYEPQNCRWADTITQATNTRKNTRIAIGSDTKCLSEWARESSINATTLTNRVSRGWKERSLLRPPITGKKLEFCGHQKTVMEWSKETGIPSRVIYDRLTAGWTVEDTLSKQTKPPVRLLTFRGKTQSLSCWAKELNINASTLSHRLGRGWSVEQALSKQ